MADLLPPIVAVDIATTAQKFQDPQAAVEKAIEATQNIQTDDQQQNMLLDWMAKMEDPQKLGTALLNVQQQRLQNELERMAASEASQPRVQNNGIRAESVILQKKEPLTQEAINSALRAAQSRSNIL